METFVVRVFVPIDGDGVPFCGIVEHPGSGLSTSFRGMPELVRFVLRRVEKNPPDGSNRPGRHLLDAAD